MAGEDEGEGGLAEEVRGSQLRPTSSKPGRLCPSRGGVRGSVMEGV